MSASGYTLWNVTAGEVPTTAYWNILGFNDASFNNGNGFNDGIIISRHLSPGIPVATVAGNPYKFSVARNGAWSASSGSSVVVFDTVIYDTNNNYNSSTGVWTCPATGFYHFDCNISLNTTTGSTTIIILYKNNAELKRGERSNNFAGGGYLTMGVDVPLTIGDQLTMQAYSSNAWSVEQGVTINWWTGHMISST